MNKQFPTQEKVVYIVCEDVRPEIQNKFSLLGVFNARIIVIRSTGGKTIQDQTLIMPDIAFYISFHDGEGEFVSEVRIIDPDGKNLLEGQVNKTNVVINKDEGMYIVYKFSQFPIKFGTSRIVVLLDGKEYSESFEVKFAD